MKKRKKKVSSVFNGSTLMKAAGLITGLVAGAQIKKMVEQKDAVSGTDLLGLDGKISKFTSPAIVAAAGLAGAAFMKNDFLKNVGMGIAVAGGAGLVNAATGKDIVTLGSADEQPVFLPGVGSDDVPQYDELPSNNELATKYDNPYLQPVGEVETEEPEYVNGEDEYDTVGATELL